jgi:tetratricopeptide (TPR) repeat protein
MDEAERLPTRPRTLRSKRALWMILRGFGASRTALSGFRSPTVKGFADARVLHERALAIREQALGPGHPDVAQSLNSLANVHLAVGAHATARAMYESAISIREQALGPRHPKVGASLSNLAAVHLAEKKPQDALPLLERAVSIFDLHEDVQTGESHAHFNLARALVATGADRARALAEAGKSRDGFREAGEAGEAGEANMLIEIDQFLAQHNGEK